ncbi:glycoside hydrolase family 3 protein [Streptomyces marincola]|uniref:Exo-alpha-(1->6)-L-arabinopyranosidase n=1 Tax=Streptomyces marincola TaxID=2878388 RepID=A0A1W7CTR9_9ACTN|nr:glycoside hydrolase family 3 protein [Streptomyces marincola]ARQ68213.1 sugar hydrolase [Streptomyces marincola]
MTAEPLPFRDPLASVEDRVADLLGRLTLAERIAMLHQFAPAIDRLGTPAFRTGQEALHGVAWMGRATVFPQAVGLGATWNDDLVRRVGEAAGREVRAMRAKDPKVGLNVWSPTVNLLRHPLWGRNEEGYAEDPHLTAALGAAYCRGLRGDHPVYWRTAPVLKHWLAHNHEHERDTASTSLRARVLHEYELPAFRGPVRSGAVAGVMPAYNLVNGRPNHLSPLLSEHLRTWTDLPLVVCSDAGAPSNVAGSQGYLPGHPEGLAAALRAGVDSFTDHGEDSAPTVERLTEALERGLITEADIDTAVGRLLGMRFRLGQFDPGLDPFEADAAFDTPEHQDLARTAAEEAVVLLKNDGLLPLRPGVRVAVVGPLADEVKLDWYSGALLRRTTPFAGLRDHPSVASAVHVDGSDLVRLRTADGFVRVPEAAGDSGGAEAGDSVAALDPALLRGRTDLPPLRVAAGGAEATVFSLLDWGGGVCTLRAPDGRYVSVADDGYLRASAEQPGGWIVQETFTFEPHGAGHLLKHLGTGRHVRATGGGLMAAGEGEAGDVFHLETTERGEDAVAAAAAGADVVVVVAGNDPHINGRETEDRTTLALPPQQDRLWRAAHAANPRTVLVLTSAYPYAVRDADTALPALLWTAHGGQAAGTALARVLCGDVSPAGRLPQTWYTGDDELPALLDYDLIAARATYLYYDGTPLYPFGHGLSYTSFDYTALAVRADQEAGVLDVEVTVANTGGRAGDEVVQVYARAESPGVPRPHRALIAHRRVHLAAGESRRLAFAVPLDDALGHWDVAHSRWAVEPGTYTVSVGASSRDLRGSAAVHVGGAAAGPRPVRRAGLAAADFDDSRGTELTDTTRETGDAVAAGPDEPGELLFRSCDFGDSTGSVRLRAAREEPGTATVTVEVLGTGSRAELRVPSTGDRYAWTTVTAALPGAPGGVRDVRLTLRGPVRVDRLDFS